MASLPSNEDIDTFLSFTSCGDKQLAVRFLQGANYDVSQAVNNYFENPSRYVNVGCSSIIHSQTSSYRESLLTGARNPPMTKMPSPKTETAEPTSTQTPSQVRSKHPRKRKRWTALLDVTNMAYESAFQIHAPDEPPQSYSHSSAPTRPPSRASHHGAPSSMEARQESGVVSASGQTFGPATQPHYDPSRWALTKPVVSESEVYADVALPFQQRTEGEPMIVKPVNEAPELAALLTILLAIPLAVEMFLSIPTDPNSSEEFDDDLSVPRIELDTTNTEEMSDGAMTPEQRAVQLEFVRFAQRLAALMLFSNRSYINMETLFQHKAQNDSRNAVPWFLAEWAEAIQTVTGRQDAAKLFRIHGVEGELSGDEDKWQRATLDEFNLFVPQMDDDAKATLYDVIDETVWESNRDGDFAFDIWLQEVPHILVLHPQQQNSRLTGLNMEVPLVFYMDRYMVQNVRQLRAARQSRKANEDQILLLNKKIERMSTYNPFINGKQVAPTNDSKTLFKETIKSLKATEDKNDPDEAELIRRLEFISNKIESKVQEFKKQIEDIKETIKERNNHFKAPNTYGPLNPTHAYTLRGVSVSPGVVYVRCPAVENPEETEWWRLEYNSAPQIVKTKASEEEVLYTASSTSGDALLVYATEEACKPIPALDDFNTLTPHLQAFIEEQNRAFEQAVKIYNESMDWSAGPQVINSVENDEDPPPYNANDSQDSFEWCPDPGPSVMSDQEYAEDAMARKAGRFGVGDARTDGGVSMADALEFETEEEEQPLLQEQKEEAATEHEAETQHIEDAEMGVTAESQGGW